jgi:hypothetical protein
MNQSEDLTIPQDSKPDKVKSFSNYLLIKINGIFVGFFLLVLLGLPLMGLPRVLPVILVTGDLTSDLFVGIFGLVVTFFFVLLYGKKNWREYCGTLLENFLTMSLTWLIFPQFGMILGIIIHNNSLNSELINVIVLIAALVIYQVLRDLEIYLRSHNSKVTSKKWNLLFILQLASLVLLTITNSEIFLTPSLASSLPVTTQDLFIILSKIYPLSILLFYVFLPPKVVIPDTIDHTPKKRSFVINWCCTIILPLLILGVVIYARALLLL